MENNDIPEEEREEKHGLCYLFSQMGKMINSLIEGIEAIVLLITFLLIALITIDSDPVAFAYIAGVIVVSIGIIVFLNRKKTK
jgi:uncharacterized integral membrane protein